MSTAKPITAVTPRITLQMKTLCDVTETLKRILSSNERILPVAELPLCYRTCS